MSRIDEALRRAAQQSPPAETGDAPDAFPADDTAEGQEVDTLAREPFPFEMTNRTTALHAAGPARTQAPGAARTTSQRQFPAFATAGAGGHRQDAHAEPGDQAGARTAPGNDETRAADSVFERIDHTLAEKVVADRNISPLSREQYRRLAASLHDAQSNTGINVIMIASAVSGEGKTLTASNLALTLSESYQKRVLLIDADLRKPTLHQVFRINSTLGLSNGLETGNEGKLTVHQVSPRLSVLPAGRPTSDPMAGLISDRMRRLVTEAKETFDWVIIDTPPVVLLPDANLLAAMVDATVLVVRANSTPFNLVKRATDAIGAQRIIGTVLNQSETGPAAHYGAYYSYGKGTQYLDPEAVTKA